MKITICGSMTHKLKMKELSEQLEKRGYTVETPDIEEGRVRTEFDKNIKLKQKYIDEHFAKIDASEAILVVNETKHGVEGYIGGNTLIEMARAYGQGLDIFLLNPIPDMSYTDEIRGMRPTVLGGSLDALDTYVANLPLVYMSTESALKHSAVARAMRKAGVSVRIDGKKVDSGVNEQPMTINETYEGAMNRQKALHQLGVAADYYVTVESGQHPAHENHSLFGCTVIIIEPAGKAMKVGIDIDVEYPREWFDKVPSVYPDVGVLVMEEYSATEKDPVPYITQGGMTRRSVIENAAYNVAVQLEGQTV